MSFVGQNGIYIRAIFTLYLKMLPRLYLCSNLPLYQDRGELQFFTHFGTAYLPMSQLYYSSTLSPFQVVVITFVCFYFFSVLVNIFWPVFSAKVMLFVKIQLTNEISSGISITVGHFSQWSKRNNSHSNAMSTFSP